LGARKVTVGSRPVADAPRERLQRRLSFCTSRAGRSVKTAGAVSLVRVAGAGRALRYAWAPRPPAARPKQCATDIFKLEKTLTFVSCADNAARRRVALIKDTVEKLADRADRAIVMRDMTNYYNNQSTVAR